MFCVVSQAYQSHCMLVYSFSVSPVSSVHMSCQWTRSNISHCQSHYSLLTDSIGEPFPLPMDITAQLEAVSKATPTTEYSKFVVTMTSPSRYEVSYTPVSRGRHKLHVQVNDKEINGSPFTVTVYADPASQ